MPLRRVATFVGVLDVVVHASGVVLVCVDGLCFCPDQVVSFFIRSDEWKVSGSVADGFSAVAGALSGLIGAHLARELIQVIPPQGGVAVLPYRRLRFV